MAITIAQAPKHHVKVLTATKTDWSLSVFVANFFGYSCPEDRRQTEHLQKTAEPTSPPDHISDLLKRIDQGYILEETGERAYIPRFARAWVQSSVSSDD